MTRSVYPQTTGSGKPARPPRGLPYKCGECGTSDRTRYVRCFRANCPDGRDQGATPVRLQPGDPPPPKPGWVFTFIMGFTIGAGLALLWLAYSNLR